MFKDTTEQSKLGVRILLFILSVLTITSGFYLVLLSPITLEKEGLKSRIQDISAKSQDINSLMSTLESLKSDLTSKETELTKKKEHNSYGNVTYSDVVDFVGKKAKLRGIEVISLEERTPTTTGMYWEIPFAVTLVGDYHSILSFVNDISALKNYHVINSASLNRFDSNYTSSKDGILSSTWAEGTVDIIKSLTSEYADKELDSTEEEAPIDSKLRLDLELKFISFDSPDSIKNNPLTLH